MFQYLFSIEGFIQIPQYEDDQHVKPFEDFEIAEIRTGTGNDDMAVTALPLYRMNIIDAGGSDTYNFEFDQADAAQSVARVDIDDDIVNDDGIADQIDIDLDSTGFEVYLHPQQHFSSNPG